MDIEIVDPVVRPGWDRLLLESGDDCFFHTAAWARTFVESYGYRPVYFSAFGDGGKIALLLPMMEVRSFITGTRGVSLPYTDHCPVFAPDPAAAAGVFEAVAGHGRLRRWRYAEFRGQGLFPEGAPAFDSFYTHDLDLKGPDEALFSSLKENNRRNIRKAQKDGIAIGIGGSAEDVETFYKLNCLTRKRHGLPPQPPVFFRKLLDHVISKGYGTIVSAAFGGRTIAASMYFRFGRRAVFKYGASDIRDQGHRPNNLIMWEAMKRLRDLGCETMNLGRTESDNPGLLRYKRTWGARESRLEYFRYDLREDRLVPGRPEASHYREFLARRVPLAALKMLGKISYRHFG